MKELYLVIIIGFLLMLILILVIVLITKKTVKIDNTKDIIKLKEEEYDFKMEVLKLINESNQNNQNKLFNSIDEKFGHITKSVNSNISESFKKTDETFVNVIERLTKIDEQNKNINNLSKEVLSLNNILTDKLTRGTFGEVQLYKLLEATLGNNKSLYETQTKLSNGRIPDAVIYAPKPLGKIAIDSKFPLENYQRLIDPTNTKIEKDSLTRAFINDLKTHIKDISSKYIISDETANQAIMFIPAESIYLEIVSNQMDIINFAYSNNVWITSPTTLIASLTVIEAVSNSVRQNEQTNILIEELKSLATEFKRYKDRSDNISKRVEGLYQDMNELMITNNKIYKRFIEIEQGKLDNQ